MSNITLKRIGIPLCIFLAVACKSKSNNSSTPKDFHIDKQLEYCVNQASKTLKLIPDDKKSIPRNISNSGKEWNFVEYNDWTSGFWPGQLWYLYEYTHAETWKKQADKFSRYLTPLSISTAADHDLGFQVFNSFGNGYKLTKNLEYRDIVLKTADTLASLFNPRVGTILSWPRAVPNMDWPEHNTIIDNMVNLELLFWAAKNGGDPKLYNMAVSHAEKTMKNHFRPDYTSYHVVVYNRETGERIKRVTHQGYADDSMWARGQAWAIYGYTMVYRETGDSKYIDFAHKITKVYLDRLPKDLIPFWDFEAPNIPDEPRDASAAAVVASALLELSSLTKDSILSQHYDDKALAILKELSENYQSGDSNYASLKHSTGHKPAGNEIDYSINYADYYYVEALLRAKKKAAGISLLSPLP